MYRQMVRGRSEQLSCVSHCLCYREDRMADALSPSQLPSGRRSDAERPSCLRRRRRHVQCCLDRRDSAFDIEPYRRPPPVSIDAASPPLYPQYACPPPHSLHGSIHLPSLMPNANNDMSAVSPMIIAAPCARCLDSGKSFRPVPDNERFDGSRKSSQKCLGRGVRGSGPRCKRRTSISSHIRA